MATVTCHTPTCAKNGEAVPDLAISWEDEETGETRYVGAVVCGACGQEISDIDPPIPEGNPA